MVTSSWHDLLDEAHRVHYLPGPIIDASDDGGGHGGAVALDDGKAPVEAMATRSNATLSITELRRT